jgi:hypothetical protein
MNPQEAFLDMLVAAMKDAVLEAKITQLKTALDARGDGKLEHVRIVVLPERMDYEWPDRAPLGSKAQFIPGV